MEPGSWLVFSGILLCASAAAFFALAEGVLFSLSKWQSRRLAEHPSRGVQRLHGLLNDPAGLLSSLLLGGALAQWGVALFIFVLLSRQWHWLTVALITVGAFLLVEVVPKIIGAREPLRWVTRLGLPVWGFHALTAWLHRPLERAAQWLVRSATPRSIKPQPAVSEDEYNELLDLAHEQGAIARSERDIIRHIVTLDRKTAGDVMRPRTQIAAVSDDDSVEDMLAAARKHKYRQLPIYDESLDTIVGVLDTRKLLLDPHIDLSEVIEFPSNVPESMNLLQLLKSLQRLNRGLAIVLDEFGGTAGLVTIEDILEEVVGDIGDRGEVARHVIETLGDNRWKATGSTPLTQIQPLCPDLAGDHGVETIGGLVVKLFEVVPSTGQSIMFRNVRLTAQQTDERRVREVLVERVK